MLSILFEKAPDSIFLYDQDGNFIDGNEEAEKLTGYKRDELRGKNFLSIDLLVPEDIPRAAENLQETLKNERTGPTEYMIKRKDDTTAYIEVRTYPFVHEEQNKVMGIARDITQRKKYEKTLEKSQTSYKKLIDQASDALVVTSDRNVMYANDALVQLIGYDNVEDLIGLPLRPFFHPDDQKRIDGYTQARRKGDYAPTRYQLTILNRGGKVIDAEIQINVIEWEGSRAVLAILRDITQQKLFETRREGIYQLSALLSKAKTVEEISKQTLDIINRVLDYEMVAFHIYENNKLHSTGGRGYIPNEKTPHVDKKSISAKVIRLKTTINVPDVRKDPDYFCVSSSTLSELDVPILTRDKIFGVLNVESTQLNYFTKEDELLLELLAQHVASAIDRVRTDSARNKIEKDLFESQIRFEQEKEVNHIKTRFMSTATHELRTPLSSIQGYIEIIQDDQTNLSQKQLQYFDVIQRNVQRLSVLTDDLLNKQRLEEGKMTLNIEQVKTKELIQDIINEFTPILNKKKQTLQCNSTDTTIYFDKLRITQVIANLLSNASKFSPEGSNIYLNVSECIHNIFFSVSDTGVGISHKDIPKLFTPFPDIMVEGNGMGTGLGLVISKGIVELHGGEIWAESEGIGNGTTITFTLPLKTEEVSTQAPRVHA